MTRKIGVIGMGHVGSTVAHYIVADGFADDLVLIDPNEKKVNADATDFEDAMSNLPVHTNLIVNDYSALKDADVVISAVGNIGLQKDNKEHDRFIELPFTKEAVKSVSQKLKDSGFSGILVNITNPCDVITMMYQHFTGFPKNRVIGTGTLLDSSRMRRAVSAELKIDPRSVTGYNLGEHGNSQFTAWSAVRVLGQPITKIAAERHIDLSKLDEVARAGGYTVFHGKHYTNYGIASAAVRLANIIISDAHTEIPVSNYHEEYGTYLSYPAIVGRDGIIEQIKLNLTDDEKEKLQTSANYIRTRFEDTLADMEGAKAN
ncbi:L-lactate dehydrogenase [Lentilactobacillus hilgardii]|uniref:NAD(P)-binding domain-containing protein n=1 Tax=Lentilactobacillus hilgardii TaxID=1588 RepID=A0A6P1E8D2_LENHI|nr:L-lactate dehydrogenase [Lentilactobacillus hilgardii]EEI71645.1 lactate/malate dehydrogenase, NAD binding domain protein [Lentilactobacillus hilgardii ATCC 27305]MCT3392948.1 L-lactate dehydrogenase [Lentilactobacillus hilgardii]QHB51501.1 NAD(P)-binding domain-containing protein [Lentilactobacillus hilgardii]RRG07005.1 MAG: L-lactate dehydrogenase [Lactobacillus sp.]